MRRPGRRRRTFLAAALLAAAACGSFEPSAALAGTWVLTPSGVPGSGLDFTLTDESGVVSGTGERLIEAGPTLAFSVTGTQSGLTVTLRFDYAAGAPDRFTGALTDATHLKGTLTTGGGSTMVQFVRANPS